MKSRLPAIVSLGFVLCCASAAHAQGGAASPSSESPASSLPAPVAADASESIVTDRPDGERFFNTGLTCLIDDDFQLDARAGVGLNNNVAGPDYFFGFGFARRF